MRKIVVVLALLGATPAWAAEPVGCENFKWPVTRERAALTKVDLIKLASGNDLTGALPIAAILDLRPAADAKLPSAPERAPKPDTFAGFITIKSIPTGGLYTISLSGGAWVDVVQNGAFLKPKAFSGVTGCEGIRKSMKFDLAAGQATIQVSGVSEASIKLAVMPVTE